MYKETAFYKKFQDVIKRGLKDSRDGIEFQVDKNRRYADDPNQEKYEIPSLDGEEYFVFVFSLMHIAFPVDEANFFDPVRIQFDMKIISPTSESQLSSIPLSVAVEIIAILFFLTFMYFAFPQLRTTAFGLIDIK